VEKEREGVPVILLTQDLVLKEVNLPILSERHRLSY